MEDQSLFQSVSELLAQTPAPVRNFVLNELPKTTEGLMRKHQLHIDHGGVLEAELLLLLVGQSTPSEFVKNLADAGVPQEKIKAIAVDVNTEVFMRLRNEERASAQTPPTSPVASVPPVKAPVPIYSPAQTAPPAYVTQAFERPPVQKQVPPPPVLPGQMPEPERPAPPPPPRIEMSEPPKQAAPAPETGDRTRIIHTMARDMQAVKSGTDPMRVAHPAPPAWATAPSPKTAAPPAPTPPPAPVQPQPPVPSEPKPATLEAGHHPQVLTQHLKQYGVDPYREPVE